MLTSPMLVLSAVQYWSIGSASFETIVLTAELLSHPPCCLQYMLTMEAIDSLASDAVIPLSNSCEYNEQQFECVSSKSLQMSRT